MTSPRSPADRGRQVARGDLRGRPPEDVVCGLRDALSAPDASRRVTREQLAAQHRNERLRLDVRSRPCRDVLGGGVGHLGRQAAELHREVDAVAGGVDAVEAAHGAVLVDRDKAVVVLRHAVDRAALQPRERDDALDTEVADLGLRAGDERHAVLAERLLDRVDTRLTRTPRAGALRASRPSP